MKTKTTAISLTPIEMMHLEELCEHFKISKSTFFKICADFVYKKEIAKKDWPLRGFTEKYHITAENLGKITNTCYKDIDYAVMDEFYKGDKDNGR